jgi:hypothetical protein
MINRHSLAAIAALALAGCGGQIAPTGGAMTASHATHGKSWMLPGITSDDLLYATGGCDGTCVLTYPGLQLVGDLYDNGIAICSDSQGNIFMPKDSKVTEYAHGGTSSVATLTLPGNAASGCSIDPITNNLAVVFQAQVAIFQDEEGTPTVFETHIDATYCTYDDSGNLFVNGYGGSSGSDFALAELASGASGLTTISVSNAVGNPGQLHWDGKYLVYQSFSKYGKLSRLQISGSSATIVGTITLKGIKHHVSQSWLYNGQITVPYSVRGQRANVISTWNYPKGGRATNTIRKFDSFEKREIDFSGVAVSVAPSR